MAGLGITIAFHSYRKQVVNYNEAPEEDNTVIDHLPDYILCDIVSRLNLNEAVQTSILSRSWRRIWTMNNRLEIFCISALNISNKYHDHVGNVDKQRFFRAVYQCLELYSGRKLRIFSLRCCFLTDYIDHLVQWMLTLARLDVEQLCLGSLCLPPKDHRSTFSFKLINGFSKLWFFRLTSCRVETTFISQCNSLLSLDLRCITLVGHELSDILVGCPNLTSLLMEGCILPRNLSFSVQNLKLQFLSFHFCFNVQRLEISLSHVLTIDIDICSQVEILLSSVPKLNRLHLRTPGMNYVFEDGQRDLPQLHYLMIQTPYQILQLPPAFQVFRNIKVLVLLTSGEPYPEASEEVDLWNFAPVLHACPLLEKFLLEVGGPVCREERNAQWPVLQHQHLYFMELSGFSNTGNEREFCRYILTNALVLRRFRLRLSSRRISLDGRQFYFEGEREMDAQAAQAVCANLQVHALSRSATVELF